MMKKIKMMKFRFSGQVLSRGIENNDCPHLRNKSLLSRCEHFKWGQTSTHGACSTWPCVEAEIELSWNLFMKWFWLLFARANANQEWLCRKAVWKYESSSPFERLPSLVSRTSAISPSIQLWLLSYEHFYILDMARIRVIGTSLFPANSDFCNPGACFTKATKKWWRILFSFNKLTCKWLIMVIISLQQLVCSLWFPILFNELIKKPCTPMFKPHGRLWLVWLIGLLIWAL